MSDKFMILPVKKTDIDKKYNIPEILPKPPFCLVAVAPTKSGKSNLILNLIYRAYKPIFEEIIYISPTLKLDSVLEKSVNIDDDIVKIDDTDDLKNVDSILDEIVQTQKEKSPEDRKEVLIILDDMISYFKSNGKSQLNDLPSLSRHYKISFIISSQVYIAPPSRLRKNASHYIIFRLFNKKDLKTLYEEVGANFPDFEENYNKAVEEKFSFLYLDNREMKMYKRFEELLWSKY